MNGSGNKVDMSLEEIIQNNKGNNSNNRKFIPNRRKRFDYNNANNNNDSKLSKLDQELPSLSGNYQFRGNMKKFPPRRNIYERRGGNRNFRREDRRNRNRGRNFRQFDEQEEFENDEESESNRNTNRRKLRSQLNNDEISNGNSSHNNGKKVSITLKKTRISITNLHNEVNNSELRVNYIINCFRIFSPKISVN